MCKKRKGCDSQFPAAEKLKHLFVLDQTAQPCTTQQQLHVHVCGGCNVQLHLFDHSWIPIRPKAKM